MKKFLSAILAVIVLASCGKKDVCTPEQQPVTAGKVFYKDANIAIEDIKGTTLGAGVKVQFSSLYEKNVVKMELMSGPYENMLCFIHEEAIPTTSLQRKNYNITEENANTSTRYYVIKYTLKSGGWVLTPAFKYDK
jgi:hypothetical protein